MASITSLSNSSYNTSSIYGSRNVLSGLASGMDTEQMIENAVSGIKLKIENLTKKRTKVEWQQEAYRSIIDKMANLDQKYSSYASATNLMSNSFFANAVNSVTRGTYADKVSASGRTSSDVQINAVKQLATAASYTVSGLAGQAAGKITGEAVDLGGTANVNAISGSLTIKYGGTNGTSFDISFGDQMDWSKVEGETNAEKLAKAINEKLGELTYNYTAYGLSESKKADQVVKAVAGADGTITFEDKLGNGNSVSISSAIGSIGTALGIKSGDKTIKVEENFQMNTESTNTEYLSGKKLTFSLNGVKKTVTLGEYNKETTAEDIVRDLQDQLDKAFGKGKVTAADTGKDGKLALSFDVKEQGSTLGITGQGLKSLGLQEDGAYNYVNTGKKLGDLLGGGKSGVFTQDNLLRAVGDVKNNVDSAGNSVRLLTDENGAAVKDKDGKDIYYRVDKEGKALYDFQVNDAHIAVTEDTTLESLINSVNSNADAGVKISYSKMTNEFKFTATETGANSKIELGGVAEKLFAAPESERNSTFAAAYGIDVSESGSSMVNLQLGGKDMRIAVTADTTMDKIAATVNKMFGSAGYQASVNKLSGQLEITDKSGNQADFSFAQDEKTLEAKHASSYTAGQDAIMDVTVNGKRFENLTRSGNSFDIDGLTVNVKGTFETGADEEAVTFETSADADKIVDAIKGFVNDYNEMVTELKNAYSTLPATNSKGQRYEPLTAEQEDSYSETELKAYNEKAKQGILFGDRLLSQAYEQLRSAVSPSGTDGKTLREIGIDTAYSGGLTTISLDESKLRAALESNPDKVRDAFTKTKENGAASNGLMTSVKNALDAYAKTTGEPKGLLIQQAGSAKAYTSLNNNTLKSQIDNYDSQIDRWTEKMADQIDRYTSQFSKLEQLIAEMNSQSSALMGLMGGSSGY